MSMLLLTGTSKYAHFVKTLYYPTDAQIQSELL